MEKIIEPNIHKPRKLTKHRKPVSLQDSAITRSANDSETLS